MCDGMDNSLFQVSSSPHSASKLTQWNTTTVGLLLRKGVHPLEDSRGVVHQIDNWHKLPGCHKERTTLYVDVELKCCLNLYVHSTRYVAALCTGVL